MRILTGGTTAKKNANSSAPINLLKIVPTGAGATTKYYSDRALTVAPQSYEAVVMSWGAIEYRTHEDGHASTSMTVVLADPDKSMLSDFDTYRWQRGAATLYQYFEGLAESDLVVLLEGIVTGPPSWNENERTLSIDLIDLATKWDKPVGTLATREVCPDVASEDEGRMLPIVYGEGVKRVKAIAAKVGKKGRLLKPVGPDDTTFYVEGFEEVAQGSTISLRIGSGDGLEVIEGQITGTELSNVTRGKAIVTGQTTTSQLSDELCSIVTNAAGVDGQYAGYYLKVHVPRTGLPGANASGFSGWPGRVSGNTYTWQYKRITGFESATGRITWEGGQFFKVADFGGATISSYIGPVTGVIGRPYLLPDKKDFSIVTLPSSHAAGEEMTEVGTVRYIFADHKVQRVHGIWAKGSTPTAQAGKERGGKDQLTFVTAPNTAPPALQDAGPGSVPIQQQGWIGYQKAGNIGIHLEDSASFPGIGHAVATLTMPMSPTQWGGIGASSDEIWVDVDGALDGSQVLIQNPIRVIEDILKSFGGLTVGELDDSIKLHTESERIPHLRFRLYLEEQRPLIELCSELAFQARCRFYVSDAGLAAIQYLTHWGDSNVGVIDDDKITLDSFGFGWRELEAVVTRVRYAFSEGGDRRYREIEDSTAVENYGVRQREIDLTALATPKQAAGIAKFWLTRWMHLNKVAILQTGLHTLELQPGDQVGVMHSGILDSIPARIDVVRHAPGDGVAERPDLIGFELALPLWPGCVGCQSNCEIDCELICEAIGCETGCESDCEDACQTLCQDYCEASCESILEVQCADGCMTGCTIGCEWSCTGSGMAITLVCAVEGCETSCDGGCETLCQELCETACQDLCETICQ